MRLVLLGKKIIWPLFLLERLIIHANIILYGFQECQPLPPDVLYFKNTEFTKTCKIQSKCYGSNTVAIIKKLQPELEWFENHPQFCHIFHMPDEPYLKLLVVWMLLLRTIPLKEGDGTAWFAVNGVSIRYSTREHALISFGLRWIPG